MTFHRLANLTGAIFLVVLIMGFGGCADRDSETNSDAMRELLPNQIAAWTLQDSVESYDRETIFDYINGAGEVYRSYAFSEVVVARYSASERSDLLVELFDMGGEADAYGVFSYAREREEEGIGGGYEHKGDVLCFWQNRYYACLTFDEPTPGSDTSLVEAATAISGALPSESTRPAIVDMLPTEGLVPFSERFFHVHQSLNYHYYLARENLLNLSSETDVVFARYAPGTTYLMVIEYRSERDAETALDSFKRVYLPDAGPSAMHVTENGKFVACSRTGQFVVVILDAESEIAAEALMVNAIDGITTALTSD